MVRTVLELNNKAMLSLRTSDLSGLRLKMGEEVFDYFCCCFVYADRLTSLVNFSYFSKEKYSGESIAGRRDRLTSVWLMVGTLKELGLNLHKLRNALVVANLWDKAAWKR